MEKVSRRKITRRVKRISEPDFHKVNSLEFKSNKMLLKVDGEMYEFELKDISKKLAKASKKEREAYKVISSGYGISWPLIDEDLSIDGLIKTNKALR